MANWKTYINSGFSGCRLLSYARDHCRERDVRIWLVPGEFEAVGITDGTDAWIAPVSADCFSVNVKRLLDDLVAGRELPKPIPLANAGRQRRRLITEEPPPNLSMRPRRPLIEVPAPTPTNQPATPRRPRATLAA